MPYPDYPRAERAVDLAPDVPEWLQRILLTTPDYPPGPKGPQFNPRDVPIVPGSPAGQLMFDPMLSRQDEQILAGQPNRVLQPGSGTRPIIQWIKENSTDPDAAGLQNAVRPRTNPDYIASGEQIRSRIGAVPQSAMQASNTKGGSTNMYNWTSEQQPIVNRIMSGQQDYTFGPGSPNPTTEDMGTYVGGPHSPASGFAVHGGVALAPGEYHLFTPEQRRYLGVMDIAPADQAGKIERYYGGSADSPSRSAMLAPSPATGGYYAQGTAGAQGSNAGAMGMYDPSVAYGSAPSQTSQGISAGLGVLANALKQIGQNTSKQTDPMTLMQKQKPLSFYSPAQFPMLPYT